MKTERARLDALPSTYPKLFPKGPLTWGFEHGDGWAELVCGLCADLDELLRECPQAFIEVRQVKEKFGQLRFYYTAHGVSKELRDGLRNLVDKAERASGHICERCGSDAASLRQTDSGWLATLCPRCQAALYT